jgi:hypothetical protein
MSYNGEAHQVVSVTIQLEDELPVIEQQNNNPMMTKDWVAQQSVNLRNQQGRRTKGHVRPLGCESMNI